MPLRNAIVGNLYLRFVAACSGLLAIGTGAGAAEPAWQQIDAGRFRELNVPQEGKSGFTLLGSTVTGVTFSNTLDEASAAANRVLLNGSGLALGDCDGDGRPDIFLASLNGQNTLYRNLGGWRFADVTVESGLRRDARFYRGATFADVNGDGALDLLLAVLGHGVEVWLNDGRGRFVDGTGPARTASAMGSATVALADVDGNGTLDLYVANNRVDDIRDRGQVNLRKVNGAIVVPPEWRDRLTVVNGQVLEYGQPDQLYLNDGRGRFAPVAWAGGRFRDEAGNPLAGPPLDWGLTASFRDINGDGFPDLYVCNDFWTPDRIWINDGKGRFQAASRLAFRSQCASSMGVDFADVDRDGQVDLFVVDMLSRDPRLRKRQALAQTPGAAMAGVSVGREMERPQVLRNTLFRNRGDGTFAELAYDAGVAASDWSWSPVFLDVDLDGYEDLLVASGHARDVQDLDAREVIRSRQHEWKGFKDDAERQRAFTQELMEHMRLYPPLEMPVVAFRNLGNGRFSEVTGDWGIGHRGVHHAIAMADLDGDGDLDLVVNNLGSPAGIYRNESPSPRVAIRLKGIAPNTQGIGARVTLEGGAVARQSQEIVSGGRYLAGAEPMLVFAAGQRGSDMAIEVAWRSGRRSRVERVRPNRLYELQENPSGAVVATKPAAGPASTLGSSFVDFSPRLNHVHRDESFDDYARQPLLPWKLSQGGPGVAWFDLDGDGTEELFIGAGRGSVLGAYQVTRRAGGNLSNSADIVFQTAPLRGGAVVPDDTAGILGWVSGTGRRSILAGITGYENPAAPSVLEWRVKEGGLMMTNVPAIAGGGVGALAAVDLDGDGDLDLFVGGTALPGRYPESSPARILRGRGDPLQLDAENTRVVAGVGLVNGATWSDLDADGWPELILACEWGPIRVFRNHGGHLTEATEALGFSPSTGWWKGVTTGDLDGDGRLDIIASNWGLNSPYRASTAAPLRLYFGDLGDRGVMDLIETEEDPVSRTFVPRRMLEALAGSMPFLREQFPTVRAFSEASVEQVLGTRRDRARLLTATTLATTVFLNRGDRFVRAPDLPAEAQWSPASGVAVADLDGDGREDVFLAQNFFPTQPEVSRFDAGRSLWLRGDGAGGFVAVSAAVSGLVVDGEQRGVAAGDFDRDGRVDLVVTQNGAETKLFRNQLARPGLRVRLRGPVGNPDGVGAVVRLKSGGKWGPARAVQGGSGYWSSSSTVLVLAAPQAPEEIQVRWPGGRQTTVSVPNGATEIMCPQN